MEKQLEKDYKIQLAYDTPQEWVDTVMNDFNSFLQDHADCERKASAMAMSFVAKAPEKVEIIPELIETALEEMVHFRQVYKLMEERDVLLPTEMEKDTYMHDLIRLCRSGSKERFLDRLLIAAIVETRGAERFRLVSENLEDAKLKEFYTMLYKSEDKHGNIFVEMALTYYESDEVFERLNDLIEQEGAICSKLKHRSALH